MKAAGRIILAATTLAALGTLGLAGGARAGVPVDERVAQQAEARQRVDAGQPTRRSIGGEADVEASQPAQRPAAGRGFGPQADVEERPARNAEPSGEPAGGGEAGASAKQSPAVGVAVVLGLLAAGRDVAGSAGPPAAP